MQEGHGDKFGSVKSQVKFKYKFKFKFNTSRGTSSPLHARSFLGSLGIEK